MLTLGSLEPAFAQDDEDLTLYHIKLERLKRIVSTNDVSSEELAQYIADAKEFAATGDYDLANEFLESALDLASLSSATIVHTVKKESPKTNWSFYGLSGSELWQQTFGFSTGRRDSTLHESEANPFGGFRFLLEYQNEKDKTAEFELEAKASNEYNSADVIFDFKNRLGDLSYFVSNYFNTTLYNRETSLNYLDERFAVGGILGTGDVGLKLRSESQFRNYSENSEYFYSYFQNRLEAAGYSLLPVLGRFEIEYIQKNRSHKDKSERDFTERWTGFEYRSHQLGKLKIDARIYDIKRNYTSDYADSLYNNSFTEFYYDGNYRFTTNKHLTLRLDNQVRHRQYEHDYFATPNYYQYSFEPSLEVYPGHPFHVRFGYQYQKFDYYSNEETTSDPDIEDYIAHGPIVGLDVIAFNGFVASLSNSYEFRRYPNSPISEDSYYSLYSNRNINSLFLYLSWNLSNNWELNVLGHFDYDKEQDQEGNDSRTNLLNFELSYRF